MTTSPKRARTMAVIAATLGALAIGTSGATASAASRTARASTGAPTPALVAKKPRKGVTSWRTQRVANPGTSAVDAVIATAGN